MGLKIGTNPSQPYSTAGLYSHTLQPYSTARLYTQHDLDSHGVSWESKSNQHSLLQQSNSVHQPWGTCESLHSCRRRTLITIIIRCLIQWKTTTFNWKRKEKVITYVLKETCHKNMLSVNTLFHLNMYDDNNERKTKSKQLILNASRTIP